MERLEANGRHDEHVHGRDVCRVVTEKSFPGLRPPSPTLGHVLGDGRLRDLEAELEQFAVDARRSPKQVLPVHPPQPLPSEGRGREFESRRVRQFFQWFSHAKRPADGRWGSTGEAARTISGSSGRVWPGATSKLNPLAA